MNVRTTILVAVAAVAVGLGAAVLTTPPTKPLPAATPAADRPADPPAAPATVPESTAEVAPPPRVSTPEPKPVGKMPWERLFDPPAPGETPKKGTKKAPTEIQPEKLVPSE